MKSRLLVLIAIVFCYCQGQSQSTSQPLVLSAFFGIDDQFLPAGALPPCTQLPVVTDLMPVTFLYPIDPDSLDPSDFEVETASGIVSSPQCVTLLPANEAGENRTVLIQGDFGTANVDDPVEVRIVGDLYSANSTAEEGFCAPAVNLKGESTTNVVPLDDGPSIVFAQEITGSIQACQTGQQVIQVVWDGGIVPVLPFLPEAQLFRFYTVVTASGASLTPLAIADINDGDNYHQLCIGTTDPIVSVSFPAGIVEDPNNDPNLATQIEVSSCAGASAKTRGDLLPEKEVVVYPNPVGSSFKVEAGALEGEVVVTILSMDGQVMFNKAIETEELQATTFNTSSFPQGIYFLQIQQSNELITKKFTVL